MVASSPSRKYMWPFLGSLHACVAGHSGTSLRFGKRNQMRNRYCVNEYGENKPAVHTVNGLTLAAMIHINTCPRIPNSRGSEWTCFPSIEAAEAHFGPATAACHECLQGQGRHRDGIIRHRG